MASLGIGVGPVLFNIFVGNMDSEIKCTLSKFADSAEPSGAVDMLEGMDDIQRDLDRLERWALHLSQGNSKHSYRLDREWLESSPEEKVLGILVQHEPDM